MRKTTTNPHAIALPFPPARTLARFTAAHTRHTARTFSAMTAAYEAAEAQTETAEGVKTTARTAIAIAPADMTAAELYALPNRCTHRVLMNNQSQTGLALFAEIDRTQRADNRILIDLDNRAELATNARKSYETARENAANASAIADREKLPTLDELADHKRQARNAARECVEAIENANATMTASDRATMVQNAAARLIELVDAGDILNAFSELCSASRAALDDFSNPQAQTTTKTAVEWISAERAAELIERYAYNLNPAEPPQRIPATSGKIGTACYLTLEARERAVDRKKLSADEQSRRAWTTATTDGTPAPLCLVRHYVTVPPVVSFNAFNEEAADTAADIQTNGGINAILNQADRDAIKALFDRANLTERERILTQHAASQTAAKYAAAAYKAVMEERAAAVIAAAPARRKQTEKRAKKAAAAAAVLARWSYAFDRYRANENAAKGQRVFSAEYREKLTRRIEKALRAACNSAELDTPADLAAKHARRLAAEMRNTYRAAADFSAPPRRLFDFVPTPRGYAAITPHAFELTHRTAENAPAQTQSRTAVAAAPALEWIPATPHEYIPAAVRTAEAAAIRAELDERHRAAVAARIAHDADTPAAKIRAAAAEHTRAYNRYYNTADKLSERRAENAPAAELDKLTAEKLTARAELERTREREAAARAIAPHEWTPARTEVPAAALIAFQMLAR